MPSSPIEPPSISDGGPWDDVEMRFLMMSVIVAAKIHIEVCTEDATLLRQAVARCDAGLERWKKRQDSIVHQPDSPFGCGETWGPPLPRPDTSLHVCNRGDGHGGRHQCKCGTTHA